MSAAGSRIAVLRCWFEGNSFCPVPTGLDDFRAREWVAGAEAPAFYRDTATEMGAVEAFARQQPDCRIHWLQCAAAAPGGSIAADDWQQLQLSLLQPLRELLARERIDGVYFSLHGAMVCDGELAPEYTLLAAVRALIGDTLPLAASFDMHANLAPEIAGLADIVVGYKTYPHIDMYDTGWQAISLLQQAIRDGHKPCSAIVPAGVLLPSHAMTTASGPMAELEQLAAELRQLPGVLDATPFGGFAYADTPHCGASASVCVAGDPLQARRLADELAAHIRQRAARFRVRLLDPQQGIAEALAWRAQHGGCVAVLEPADNPMSGGIGDTPALLAALLAAPPACETVFCFIHDPAVVRLACELGAGATLQVQLGGRVSSAYGAPVPFRGTVERLCDGRFVNEGPMERGLACDWGRSVVLRSGRIRVVVTETCRSPNDPAWCRMHGIDLDTVGLWCVKAKNHFRAAFAARLARIIDTDSPGPAALDLTLLPYRHASAARA
ncbi:M81 family metallopeptidase [Vogesella oryzae]|uniref:M81 family metallopeptidase n=1 Tax=Vogesella oryzae TaxID=1735285 RepID=UPI00158240FE|nr:M81 family metallopeptidase [Vogesella oryzae]